MIIKQNILLIRSALSAVALFLFICSNAQINVFHVTADLDLNDKEGIFYALPMTLIKVDVTVKKMEHYAGPYSEYAGKYLDLEDIISNDYNEYEITGAKLSTLAEPDPDHYYFVEIGEKTTKEEKAIIISLSESGLIMGLNGSISKKQAKELIVKSLEENGDLFQYFAETNLYEKIDTIIRKVVVDTVSVEKIYLDRKWVEKSDEQKAVEAANMIGKIRESRYNLLTGYQEIPYDAGSIAYMDKELNKMEKEYLSLFTGITIEKIFHYSFYVLPDPNEQSALIPVFVFSERSGIKDANAAGGENIFLKIERTESTRQLISQINKRNQSDKSVHGFYYRIPEGVEVSLEINNDLKVNCNFRISQFGTVTFLPASITAVQFHTETGGVKSIVVE